VSADPGNSTAVRLDHVVLAPALRTRAEQALGACRHHKDLAKSLAGTVHDGYGHTPVLLFSGPSGTGKTMLAEALAGELGRGLKRLGGPDLRRSYYGESEALIRREFRQPGSWLLFLDEVDGFLKQRGSGPSAHHDDRLANVLLEELERTPHVVVLATNFADALDAALARRVLFHLTFEEPGPAERAALWRLHLPPAVAGADDVDCDRLARLALNGGAIKNASHRAILAAACAQIPLTTASVEHEAGVEAATRSDRRRPAGFGR